MEIWKHALASSVLALVLYSFFKWNVAFIFVGGVLVDIDHYFWYIFKFKSLNLFDCYNYYMEHMDKKKIYNIVGLLMVFHTIEFLAICIFLSFYYKFVLVFTIGLLLHYLLDAIFLYSVPKRVVANHSIISWILKNKQKV